MINLSPIPYLTYTKLELSAINRLGSTAVGGYSPEFKLKEREVNVQVKEFLVEGLEKMVGQEGNKKK
jgi:hypothetical protein